MASPTVGDTAPDFTLPGTDGAFHLAAHRGQTVVLVFYPGDDTKVCTKQLCEYSDQWSELAGLDATIVGISGKDLASKERFAAKRGLKVPLLADPDRAVAAMYGAKQAVLGTKRSTFVIDREGVIRFRHDATLGLTYLSADELRAAIAAT
ncbi:MAG: peroxiredoxin [Gaiellales bacterium]